MSTFLGIVIAAISVFTLVLVAWAFIWAAKKDGEEDKAIQKRLGIRRRTRLGREPRPSFPPIGGGHSGTLAQAPMARVRSRRSTGSS